VEKAPSHFDNWERELFENRPTGWKFAKSQFLVDRQVRDVLPTDEIVTVFRDGEVTLRANRRIEGFTYSEKEIGYHHIEPGDLAIHKMDGGFGAIGISDSAGKVSPVVNLYRSESFDLRYVAYLLRAAVATGYIESLQKGIRERSTEFDHAQFSNFYLLVPPLKTQNHIADFLDKETSEIDALVGELDGYIELLEKRKKTYIKELVSRLPNRMIQLNMLGAMKTGTTPKVIQFDPEGKQWIKPDGLSIESTGVRIGQDCISTTNLFPVGTTYICGIGATVGKVGYSSEEATCNQQITGIIPNSLVRAKMLFYLVGGITDLLRSTAPRSTLPILNNVRMGAYKLRVPLLEWQDEIIKKIDKEQNRLNLLIHECRELQSILVKRRQILITDVITGSKEV